MEKNKVYVANFIFEEPDTDGYKAYNEEDSLYHQFQTIFLKHNHRQGSSSIWASVLNRIRTGDQTDEDIALLQIRYVSESDLEKMDLKNASYAYYRNFDVHEHNIKMLNLLPSEDVVLPSVQTLPKGYKSFETSHGTIGNTQFMKTLKLKKNAYNINKKKIFKPLLQ